MDIPPDTGDFRLLDRRVVDALARMPERSRFLRGLVSWVGFRQTGIPFDRPSRAAGSTRVRLDAQREARSTSPRAERSLASRTESPNGFVLR